MRNENERLVRTTTRLTKRRPGAPREAKFDTVTNLLTWIAPQGGDKFVTHYRLRIGSDSDAPRYQVPVGQTTIQLTPGVTIVYLSAYNQINDQESTLVPVAFQPHEPGGGDAAGNVTALSAAAGYSATNALLVTVSFTAPDPLGTFGSIHVWAKTPAGAWKNLGNVYVTGDHGTLSEGPDTSQTWDLYAVSVSTDGTENAFDRAAPGATPHCTVAVPARPTGETAGPGPTAVIDFVSATFDYSVATQARDRFLQLHAAAIVEAGGELDGISVYWQRAGDPAFNYAFDLPKTSAPETVPMAIDILELTPPSAATTYRIVVCPFRNNQYVDPISGYYIDIAVTPVPNADAGKEYAGLVTSPTFSGLHYYDSNGVYKERLTFHYTTPTDERFGGVKVMYTLAGLSTFGWVELATVPAQSTIGYAETAYVEIDVPSSIESWMIAFFSIDASGRINTYQTGITPVILAAIGSASGTFDLRKYSPTSTVMFDIVGGQFVVVPGAALDIDPVTGRLRVKVGGVTNDLVDRTSPQKLVIINGDLAANCVMANNVVAGEISSRHLDATEIMVGGGGGKPGRFSVYDASGTAIGYIGVYPARTGYVTIGPVVYTGIYYATVSYSSGNPFGPDLLGTGIIISGAPYVVSAYFGPTQIQVQGPTSPFAGPYTAGGTSGGWLKMLGVGGASLTTPALEADASGNLTIHDGLFKLTRTQADGETYITQIDTAFTADFGTHSFSGMRVYRQSATAHKALLINRGVVVYNPNGYKVGCLVSYNGDSAGGNAGSFWGSSWVADEYGAITVEQNGHTGMSYAKGGFQTYTKNSAGAATVRTGWTGVLAHLANFIAGKWNPTTNGWDVVAGGLDIWVDNGIITDVTSTTRTT